MPFVKQYPPAFPLEQDLYHSHVVGHSVQVTQCHFRQASKHIRTFTKRISSSTAIGASILQNKDTIVALALATTSHVLVIKKGGSDGESDFFKTVGSAFFTHGRTVFVLDANSFVLLLHRNLSLRVETCVDLFDMAGINNEDRQNTSLKMYFKALGGEALLVRDSVLAMMKAKNKGSVRDAALSAWAACYAGQLPSARLDVAGIKPIDTTWFPAIHLNVLWKIFYDFECRQALKPVRVKNEVTKAWIGKESGDLEVESKRYKTRVMGVKGRQYMEVAQVVEGRLVTTRVRRTEVDGRRATIACPGLKTNGVMKLEITTVGRDPGTTAEQMRSSVIHQSIRRKVDLFTQTLFHTIFVPGVEQHGSTFPGPTLPIAFTARPLNSSQNAAVRMVLCGAEKDRVGLVQGPPGTGKTTVIAAAVASLAHGAPDRGVWLVAQSNVAVKNMAEKLADVGFWDFRILVSVEFHYDWHEHLYQKIDERLIRSDMYPETRLEAERMLGGARVMLCTLSTLSVNRVKPITHVVPLHTVLVDEASQIEVGDFVPMLYQYNKTLQKLVFIGDDKQLPPYGSEDIKDLRSIFEMRHLRKRAAFLDTQYRMPTFIGDFISKEVYQGKLKSQHPMQSPLVCRFINVVHGQETSAGTSWKNEKEAATIVNLVRGYMDKGLNFRVITPYDAQRGTIEAALKHANLKWEDTVFNVDSFQGNECDNIIISLVRSGNKVGFLALQRRVNVMLTRCKKTMTIVTKRSFVEGAGSSSLVGKLAKKCGPGAWFDA